MTNEHTYSIEITWTGNRGTGTSDYHAYGREHEVIAKDCPVIPGSADPAFNGDSTRWNPEQLLLASLSQCHMLRYLHFCAVNGVVVTSYVDHPVGTMTETADGGHFTAAVLRPHVEISAADMADKARALHADARRACFIANSVSFPVTHDPTVSVRTD